LNDTETPDKYRQRSEVSLAGDPDENQEIVTEDAFVISHHILNILGERLEKNPS
jgi:hypothetical protein